MAKKYRYLPLYFLAAGIVYLTGCTSSKPTETEEETTTEVTYEEANGALIMNAAEDEQQNEMYTKANDLTYLYWLDNLEVRLKNRTKCNIYALNVLFKAGFKTPNVNTLTKDLVDTSKFKEILPIVGISDYENAKTGDLIAWNGHVIIFNYFVQIKSDMYVMAWWAGTSQKDNGDNVRNNVIHGKYKLNGYYVVRRPVKK
jgi:hypothetical protein